MLPPSCCSVLWPLSPVRVWLRWHTALVCGGSFRDMSTAGHRPLLLLGFCGISVAPGRSWTTRRSLWSATLLQEGAQGAFGQSGAGRAGGWQGELLWRQRLAVHREDGADGPLRFLKILAVLQPFGGCSGGFSGAPTPADTAGPPQQLGLCGGTLFLLLELCHERVTAP